ncbi:hypothetical protein CLOHIR_00749 [Peptacetobacter hiranonis DSM 13275]|uniref:Uncharacterized protein n=1 Tax=Peptacetobacter hiranonis (strain DSM 13275 / JCM 10541 / KCTC 15199 / TO-931) TaxID=500633 RepID=B6FXZ8_PEPHT|nr:hypothetical protein CLOHIR_00749 [Peptacetobacter hiranonis DSM 13275]
MELGIKKNKYKSREEKLLKASSFFNYKDIIILQILWKTCVLK